MDHRYATFGGLLSEAMIGMDNLHGHFWHRYLSLWESRYTTIVVLPEIRVSAKFLTGTESIAINPFLVSTIDFHQWHVVVQQFYGFNDV